MQGKHFQKCFIPPLSRKVGEEKKQHLFSFNTLFPRMKSSYLRVCVIDKTNSKQKPKRTCISFNRIYNCSNQWGKQRLKSFPVLYTLVKLRVCFRSHLVLSAKFSATTCVLTEESSTSQSDQTNPKLCFHTFIHNLAAGVECTINKALMTPDWEGLLALPRVPLLCSRV